MENEYDIDVSNLYQPDSVFDVEPVFSIDVETPLVDVFESDLGGYGSLEIISNTPDTEISFSADLYDTDSLSGISMSGFVSGSGSIHFGASVGNPALIENFFEPVVDVSIDMDIDAAIHDYVAVTTVVTEIEVSSEVTYTDFIAADNFELTVQNDIV